MTNDERMTKFEWRRPGQREQCPETVRKRWFNFATAISAAINCLVILAWLLSGVIDPRKQHLKLSDDCYISVSDYPDRAGVQIFSYARWGPSLDGTWFVVGKNTKFEEGRYLGGAAGYTSGQGLTESWFHAAGIYYRRFRPTSGTSIWAVSISLWYPFVASALLPAMWWAQRAKRTSLTGFEVVDRSEAATRPK
jgi:hypothetical protein